MRIYSYILTSATALLLAACVSDDTIGQTEGISFRAVASVTRGQAVEGVGENCLFPTDKAFSVYAWKETELAPFISGEKVACIGRDHWTTPNNHFWPESASVDFCAVYPEGTLFETSTRQLPDYHVTADVGSQQDLMYATTLSQTKEQNAAAGVRLNFKHALSRVSFSAVAVTEGVTVDVSSVTINNVRSTDTFSYPSLTNGVGTWLETGTQYLDYTYTMGGETLMLIPQKLIPWAVATENISTADLNRHAYLAVTCKMAHHGVYYIGTAETYGICYVPVDTQWEQGLSYNYTLQFGGGYDAEGNPILYPLTVSAEITDWTDGGNRNWQGGMDEQ